MRARFVTSLIAVSLCWAQTAAAQITSLPETPPDVRPGECFGLFYVPPQFSTTEVSQLVVPASERTETIPAQYEYVEEPVLIPAGKRRKIIKPAVTETTEETVIVPGAQRRVAVPATYKTVEQQVTVQQGPLLKPGQVFKGQEGGALCIVEQSTTQHRIKKRVLDRPASTRIVNEPAREQVVKRRKVIEPAVTEWVATAPRMTTRRVKRLVAPASTRLVPVPAQYETVTQRSIVSPARAEWQRVLCETNVTPALVQNLQEALKREGVYQGAANGQMNPQTSAALRRYQERKALPTGGLSLAMLEQLGVSVTSGQTSPHVAPADYRQQ